MPMDNGDVAKIVQFLKDSKNVLSEVITMKDALFPVPLHQPIDKAWASVEKRVEKLIGLLSDAQYGSVHPDYLSYVGLTGDELGFKLAGFYECKNIWDKFKASVKEIKKWKKILKNLLEWINVILSSLDFVLGIFMVNRDTLSLIADPIREFKDALEAGINLKEIWIKPK